MYKDGSVDIITKRLYPMKAADRPLLHLYATLPLKTNTVCKDTVLPFWFFRWNLLCAQTQNSSKFSTCDSFVYFEGGCLQLPCPRIMPLGLLLLVPVPVSFLLLRFLAVGSCRFCRSLLVSVPLIVGAVRAKPSVSTMSLPGTNSRSSPQGASMLFSFGHF